MLSINDNTEDAYINLISKTKKESLKSPIILGD